MFASGSQFEILVRDLVTDVDTRLTFDGRAKGNPSWFPSGDRVLYSERTAPESSKLIWRKIDGTGNAHEVGSGTNAKMSPDGRHAAYLVDVRGQIRLRYSNVSPDECTSGRRKIFFPRQMNQTYQVLTYPPTDG